MILRKFFAIICSSSLLVLSLASLSLAQERTAADYIQDGEIYLSRNNCPFAQSVFQEALKQEPENLEALLGKGKALTCQGALATGIEDFQKALSLDSRNVPAHVQLALAYREQYISDPAAFPGRLEDALGILQTAEGLDPNSAEVLNSKGVVLFSLNDLTGARSALERAVALADSAELPARSRSLMHINLGKTYRDLDELQLSLQSFRRAVMLSPASASAHNNVGNIYYKLGNCDQAIYELSQATNLNSTSLDALSNLGIATFECGDISNSVVHFERALEIPGALNVPPLYTYLSRAYVQQGRYEEAVQRAQQGALLPPVRAEAFFYLGQAYEARNGGGDIQRAKEAYQSAIELDPSYQLASEALARLP